MPHRRAPLGLTCAVAGMLLAAVSAAQSPTGVTVALKSSSSTVTPGSIFTVYVEVTQPGAAFNGFDAIVGYDPAALTLIPQSPLSLQEGSYMKSSCGSRFHRFQQGVDRDTATDILLCNEVAVPGPGTIYQLQFLASSTPKVTKVFFLPGLRFYNDGLYVDVANSCDATIGIGMSAGIDDGWLAGPRLRLTASPNPARPRTSLAIDVPNAGLQDLRICDLMGRCVRRLTSGYFGAGLRRVTWDGRDDSGTRLPPGLYLARLRVAGHWTDTRVVLLN